MQKNHKLQPYKMTKIGSPHGWKMFHIGSIYDVLNCISMYRGLPFTA